MICLRRPCRVNVRLLLVLVAIGAIAAVGAAGAHYARKRTVADRALQAGNAALERQDWPEACKQLKTYLAKYPNDADVLARYARAHLSVKPLRPEDVGAAIGAYRQLLRLRPGDEEACRQLARLYYTIGDANEAAYVCRQRLDAAPDDAQAMIWLGRSLMQQRKLDEATRLLAAFVERDPTQIEAYALLAEAAVQAKPEVGSNQATEWLDRAVRKNPRSAEALARRARFHRLVRKDRAAAREDLDRADQLQPSDPYSLLLLAEGWVDLGEFDRAEAELQAIRRVDRDVLARYDIGDEEFLLSQHELEAALRLRRGEKAEGVALADRACGELAGNRRILFLPLAVDLYLAAGEMEKARRAAADYREAMGELARTDRAVAEQLAVLNGALAQAEGRPYAAISVLEDVAIRPSRNPRVWKDLWQAYGRTGQDRRAQAALEKYIALQPEDAKALLELARACARGGSLPDALRHTKAAEQLRPADPDARLLRIELLLKGAAGPPGEPQLTELSRELAELQKSVPRSVEVRILQASIAFASGRAEDAASGLERAVVECDQPLRAALMLVEYRARMKQPDKALQACRAAVDRFPEAAAPRIALARLLANAGRDAEARETYEKAVASLSGDERLLAIDALVGHLLARNEQVEAMDWLRKVASERPDDVRPRLALLEMPATQKDIAESERLVDEIRRIEGDRGVRWRFERARVLLRTADWQSRHPEVVELLTRCVEADPAWSAPVLVLGRTYELLRKEDQAEQTYRRFVDACAGRPGYVETAVRLLELLERQGRYRESARILERMPGGLSAVSAHRAKVAIARGDYDAAVADLKQRIGADPKDAAARVLLARLMYQLSRDPAPALKLLDEAAAADPDLLSVTSSRVAILHGEKRDAEALACLDAEVARRKDYAAHLLRAEYHAQAGRTDLAERDYVHLTLFADRAAEGYVALAGFYERTGRIDKAVAALDAGLERVPGDAAVRRALIRLLVSNRDAGLRDRGRRLLDEAMKAPGGADDAELLFIRGEMLMRDGAPEAVREAMATFERVVQINPRDVTAHLYLIQNASEQGDTGRANDLVARALGANPENVDLLLIRAEFESELKNVLAARELAQSVLDLEPRNVVARNLLSNLALRAGQVDAAAKFNEEALRLNPAGEDAQVVRAEILDLRGRRDEAVASLESYCRTDVGRNSVKAILALADLLRMKGDYAASDVRIREAEALAPGSVGGFLVRMRWLASQGRFDEILKALAARRERYSLESQVLISVASVLASAGDDRYLREALPLFEQFIAANPSRAEGYLGLAMVALQLGETRVAEQAYRRLLAVAPYHQQALNNLSWILKDDPRNLEEALDWANKGVTRYPDDPHLLNTRAVILYKLDSLSEAQRDLEKCLVLAADIPATRARSLLYLARIHAKRGEFGLAREASDEARRIDRQQSVFTPDERTEVERLAGAASN